VFVTAYDEFAIQAFDVHALDYLLKPVDPERFRKTLSRVAGAIGQDRIGQLSERLEMLVGNLQRNAISLENPTPHLTRFIIKNAGLIYFVQSEDIDWIEAADYYVRLHTGKKNHLLRDSLNRLETRLDPNIFIRIHRSTIVNVNRIKELKPHFQGEYIVTLNDGTNLKLSRTHRDKLQALLGQSI
jgi:two-component system, LytTR family, response regulator